MSDASGLPALGSAKSGWRCAAPCSRMSSRSFVEIAIQTAVTPSSTPPGAAVARRTMAYTASASRLASASQTMIAAAAAGVCRVATSTSARMRPPSSGKAGSARLATSRSTWSTALSKQSAAARLSARSRGLPPRRPSPSATARKSAANAPAMTACDKGPASAIAMSLRIDGVRPTEVSPPKGQMMTVAVSAGTPSARAAQQWQSSWSSAAPQSDGPCSTSECASASKPERQKA
mmetsp:Transcript_1924/g.6264  ORF Transcript_1924/g.6264 Transcript_1924/m.6264 type:complete len:234 (-) Transcript_1924:319-1020(-)